MPKQIRNAMQHAGWWIPGSLEAGWSDTFQANFSDMANKFSQLKIKPLVNGLFPYEDLGFYFSEGEYDFIQLLTIESKNAEQLPTSTIVTYSIWLASQTWAHFSPIPVHQLGGVPNKLQIIKNSNTNYPSGWYFVGTFSQQWYNDLQNNYEKASKQREELRIADLSPLYFTESTEYDFVQMVQPALSGDIPMNETIMDYMMWFNGQGFGHISCLPFMSIPLVGSGLQLASKTP